MKRSFRAENFALESEQAHLPAASRFHEYAFFPGPLIGVFTAQLDESSFPLRNGIPLPRTTPHSSDSETK